MKRRKFVGGIPFKLRVGVGDDAVVFEGDALSRDFDRAFIAAWHKVKGVPSDEDLKRLKEPIEVKKDEP